MIVQLGIILLFLAAGEFIVWLTGVPVPSSIIGMLLLTASLNIGLVKPSQVERLSDFLVHNLGFFFVPAGIGLMNCLDLISREWVPIIGASAGSTVVIIAVTGWVHRLVRKALSRKTSDKQETIQVE
ncbi:MAG: CidA/LrgA family protein [Muribaculaceae bacterium]|nr:CidA/LrgA family protein [Muribaculaceae bacterium]